MWLMLVPGGPCQSSKILRVVCVVCVCCVVCGVYVLAFLIFICIYFVLRFSTQIVYELGEARQTRTSAASALSALLSASRCCCRRWWRQRCRQCRRNKLTNMVQVDAVRWSSCETRLPERYQLAASAASAVGVWPAAAVAATSMPDDAEAAAATSAVDADV